MPIETAFWRIDKDLERLTASSLDAESRLEDLLCADLSILDPDLMLLGRQVPTAYGKYIDMLALDSEGTVVVIELKRGRTPREVVAQVLDYASWVGCLSYDDVKTVYEGKNPGKEFEVAFAEAFGHGAPDEINEGHRLVIVCSDLDPSTERIIEYLSEGFSVPVNAVFFRCHKDAEREYLSRTWLVAPDEAEAKGGKAGEKKTTEPWNGRDFYVNVAHGEHRSWADCQEYGFIAAGGGRQWSKQLNKLEPGHRVFTYVPGAGYVGVGVVEERVVPVKEFMVKRDGEPTPILEAPHDAQEMGLYADDPEKSEYLVRVRWLAYVPLEKAYWESGMFALQHVVCKMRNRFTLQKLAKQFALED